MKASWLLILSSATVLVLLSNVGSRAEGQYVHFGYVPLNVRDHEETRLYIVGNLDDTSVSVYSLPELETLAEFIIDRLEERSVQVPSGSMFKVVSDKPATVILAGGSEVAAVNASISTFYTSIEGGYLGREFVFRTFCNEEGGGGVYTVYALERSEVTVHDPSGAEVTSFELTANEFKDFGLKALKTHRLVSTGYVMLQSFSLKQPAGWVAVWKSHAVPSLEGTFVGKHFYGRSAYPGLYGSLGLQYIFSSSSDARIRSHDLDNRARLGEEAIQAATNKTLGFENTRHLFFDTSEPTALIALAGGGGLLATGLRAGEVAYIRVPSEESLLFAYAETILSLDEVQYSLSANRAFGLPLGLHKIEADKTVMLLMVDYGSGPPLDSFGACLPSVQSLELDYPGVKILPLEAGVPVLLYAEAAAAVVIVVVVAVFAVKKVRSR